MSCEKRRSICLVGFCKNIGNHLFPSDETLKGQWITAIEHFKPGLTVRKYSKICSAHFKPTDFYRSPLSLLQPDVAPKRLKKTAVPSVFPWKTPPQEVEPQLSSEDQDLFTVNFTEIKHTYAREPQTTFVEEQPYLNILPSEPSEDPLNLSNEDFTYDLDQSSYEYSNNTEENITLQTEELDIAEELEIAEQNTVSPENILFEERLLANANIEKHDKSVQVQMQNKGSFSLHNILKNDKAIHFYTGLENFNKLSLVFHTLGQCANNLNYFYGNPPQTLNAFEKFFLTLIILRRHTPFEEIAMMFSVTIKQVYNIFITWVRFMALQWKNLDLWIDREIVKAYMPYDFYDKYPSTRVIIDATECPIKKPKLPFAQQVTFSSYKNRNTVKFLIGITPSGFISYVSPCYGGSATDRQIIERSSILNKFDYNDEIMVDKGLNVQDIFMPYGVKVNMPTFFKKGHQIGPQTLTSNRKVASKRVHVERIIGQLKTYKILCQPMNQTETILSSDIVFICAMLVNFRSNIINKDA